MDGLYRVYKNPNEKMVADVLCVTNPKASWNKMNYGRFTSRLKNTEFVKDWNRVMRIVRLARKELNLISIDIIEESEWYMIKIKRKIQ